MPEEKYTRCPGCATVFRVKPEQLALRGGQVRCGHCKTVFDGVAQAVSLAPPRVRHEAPLPTRHRRSDRRPWTLRHSQRVERRPKSLPVRRRRTDGARHPSAVRRALFAARAANLASPAA
jgi:predicted Zn finger-like uncharacterized protein